jgi:quercetin dioxygenase-like cupin family protein
MDAGNETKRLYEAERSASHAERPGFRITELQISPSQKVPWHYHTSVQDTFFVLQGPPEGLPPGAEGGDTRGMTGSCGSWSI